MKPRPRIMDDFRIDSIELTWSETNKYRLKLLANKGSGTNVDVTDYNFYVSGIEFNTHGLDQTRQTTFICDEIDFSFFTDPYNILEIFTNNDPGMHGTRKKKGAVVIIDTAYPPPNNLHGYHRIFSGKFEVKLIKFDRIINTETFDGLIQVSYSGPQKYSFQCTNYFLDSLNYDWPVMRLFVKEVATGSTAIDFPLKAIPLKAKEKGTPIIVMLENTAWSEQIDIKKANISIY